LNKIKKKKLVTYFYFMLCSWKVIIKFHGLSVYSCKVMFQYVCKYKDQEGIKFTCSLISTHAA